ncbi:copper resistance protein CopC [Sphaerisporangium sp. TRM90804]|uniref:copper resistance CopC family protein n=1 Tax=Sphaerisporangium sp. TRM90804 TaxID=3031113 RepID=UPI002446C026|nr:copper resistance protein CopC [Sphaerisporangium sp. TRM90804]MDH2425423.1 copper resistance protein CopC [Sphaerisporangium sp. TRM90804]
MRWFARVVLAAVLAGGAVAVVAAPAAAHGQLALSTPAKDSTVSEPLEAVELYFTEQPTANAYFTILTPRGARVDRKWSYGEEKRLDKPVREDFLVNGVWEPRLYHIGYSVKVPVAHWPEKGVYAATYLTVASDGERVKGEVRFTYSGPTSKAPKGWKTPTDQPDPALLAAANGHASGAATPQPGAPAQGPTMQGDTGPVVGTPNPVSTGASAEDSGTGLMVWLLPVLLVAGAGLMVARAARRPPAAGGATARAPAGPRPRTPKAGRPTPKATRGAPAKARRETPGKPPRTNPGKRR